jgi:hypothetical protein
MNLDALLISLVAILAASCGSDPPKASPKETGSASSSGAGGSAGGPAGAGGSAVAGGHGGDGGSDQTTGSGGQPPFHCTDPDGEYWITVEGDGDVHRETAPCESRTGDAPAPSAQYYYDGKRLPRPMFLIDGCADGRTGSPGIHLQSELLEVGTSMWGQASYVNDRGILYGSQDGFSITITSLGEVGDAVTGSFSTRVFGPPDDAGGSPSLDLTGEFRVCRIEDWVVW